MRRMSRRAVAEVLLVRAIERGLASEGDAAPGSPKQMWVIDDRGQVFEVMYGGSRTGVYHGYPIRRADPLFAEVVEAWGQQDV